MTRVLAANDSLTLRLQLSELIKHINLVRGTFLKWPFLQLVCSEISGLWITQINCNRDLSIQATPGCSQHFVGGKGSIKSFNFQGLQYFSGQELKICIRPNENSCALKFEAESNHFLISVIP